MWMKQATVEGLDQRLDALKKRVAAAVAADGPDAHQIEVDRLVWCHAYAEAARTMRAWSDATDHPLIRDLADAAELDALTYVQGADSDAVVELGLRLADLAGRLEPLEDVGASEEHRLLRSSLRDFADREIVPHAQAIHREDRDLPESIIAGLAEIGLFGLSIPTEYGGAQEAEDFQAMLIATEELSRASLGAGGSPMTLPEILVRALLRGGTEEQKRRWLPAIASGTQLVAIGVSEPDYGSDVAGLQCRATRLPSGDWEITGTKLWCTFAGRSELLMLLCRTGDGGHRGLSAFVLEKPAFPGHAFEHVPAGRRHPARPGHPHDRLPGHAHLRAGLRTVPRAVRRLDRRGRLAESRLLPPDGGLLDGPHPDGRARRRRNAGGAEQRDRLREDADRLREADLRQPVDPGEDRPGWRSRPTPAAS